MTAPSTTEVPRPAAPLVTPVAVAPARRGRPPGRAAPCTRAPSPTRS
ncbi:hypothetical protein BN2537_1727 [Streptomyces venezuelae]|nr:hypothetical protein BN2537_1727 [Streptomyces venezuelae]